MTAERVTVATPLRHFSDPTNEYKQVFCEHWAQVSGKSVRRGMTRSQAKLIWVLVDSEAFREVTWGYVSLEKRRHMGSGNPSQSWGQSPFLPPTRVEMTLIQSPVIQVWIAVWEHRVTWKEQRGHGVQIDRLRWTSRRWQSKQMQKCACANR